MSATQPDDFLLLKSLELAHKLLFPQVSAPSNAKWKIEGSDPTNQQFKPTLYLNENGKFIPKQPPNPATITTTPA
jgi:hypothetical protein